ncbi:uncharacterized protein EDB91DRAFT_370766 [Suillus paluster]|uniref:uncharacterized protein n=1 Tax=Suillus paluster TaxID=48578 RepID=UPI001B85DA39|nr:uncharacterized protein EDB91DRAFT_370766 [Suillus paluster]KAG1739855.1 hypothetical protein EDB91DRAFT_370766 [Suillus paluster]
MAISRPSDVRRISSGFQLVQRHCDARELTTVLIMDYDVDDDALRDLEAGLYHQRRHTRHASNSDSWLTNIKNSFTRPALGIVRDRLSSHEGCLSVHAEDVDDDIHAHDEDLTGMKIMFQMDSCSTDFVAHTKCSEHLRVSSVSPDNITPQNQFCSGSPISSCPSAVSSNTPPLTPDSSVGILHSTSLEIANSQFNPSFSLHISRKTPTPSLEPEHAADRRSIKEGQMLERPRCFDNLIADITFDLPQGAQPPWLDAEFEEWYWLEYTLKPDRGDIRSSASKHRPAGEPLDSCGCSMTLHPCSVYPPFHKAEEEGYSHWKRRHRCRERKQTRRRRAMAGLLSKSDELGWIDADEVRTG